MSVPVPIEVMRKIPEIEAIHRSVRRESFSRIPEERGDGVCIIPDVILRSLVGQMHVRDEKRSVTALAHAFKLEIMLLRPVRRFCQCRVERRCKTVPARCGIA